MPYVNFKEENYKLDKQIKNRKENNKKIISQIKFDLVLSNRSMLEITNLGKLVIVLKTQKNK